jgi:alcohol dehydrogenase class IV
MKVGGEVNMRFEFATAGRILFGEGRLQELSTVLPGMGKRVLVVTGAAQERSQPLRNALTSVGLEVFPFSVSMEPTVVLVGQGTNYARQNGCDLVISFGGGSAIDAGKAIAAMLTNPGDLLDYLEVIGGGKAITAQPVAHIAIPTTAGTGTEVTRNAVIGSPEHGVKVSLRSPLLLPKIALVDPELTYSLPPQITARTGMDALTQVVEPFVSNKANPLTDTVCREGMKRAGRSLLRAYRDGTNREARRDMSLASLCGGLALANAKLGAVHGFAGVLGGMINGPHGAICGRLLPPVVEVNLRALRERAPDSETLARYDEVAQILTGDPRAGAGDGLRWIKDLERTLNMPPLGSYGLKQEDFPTLIENATRSSSMKGNPIKLTSDEMQEILEKAL